MRRLAVLAALLAVGCGDGGKPTGFGVNVTVQTSGLSADLKSQIVNFNFHVRGAEMLDKPINNIGGAVQSGEARFHYLPGAHSGSLTISIDGLAADGSTVLASGTTLMPVDIVDGKSVDALVILGGNGGACTSASNCNNGHCVDGVCCDQPCSGTCESCKVAGSIGTCSPIPMNTDPDNECGAKIVNVAPDGGMVSTTDDAGTSDGGTDDAGPPPAPMPDGGIQINAVACAGTCSGSRSCTFPGATTSCGVPFCSAAPQVTSFACDGTGGCGQAANMCTDYTCGDGKCKAICNNDADCQEQNFCNLNINKCVLKKDNGATCVMPSECKSNVCALGGVCCNSQCDAPNSCTNNGSVGKCQCPGTPCPTGVACQVFYRDKDGDSFGDKLGTIANGNAQAGCAGAPPAGFVADRTDCDDGDANAHPEDMTHPVTPLDTPSKGVGTYDYNCDNVIQKGFVERPGATCAYCAFSNFGGTFQCTHSTTICSTAGNTAALACGVTGLGGTFCLCCILATEGFTATTACGQFGAYTYCGSCGTAGGTQTPFNSTKKMSCK